MAFTVGYDAGDIRSGRLTAVYRALTTPAQNAAIETGDTPPTQLGDVWLVSCGLVIRTVATFHASATAEYSGVEFTLRDPASAYSLYLGTCKWRVHTTTGALSTEQLQLTQPVLWRAQWLLAVSTPAVDANAAPTAAATIWAVVAPTRRTS